MLELETLQIEFQNYILGKNSLIQNNVVNETTVSAEKRLHIYQQSYFLRLIEILQKDYVVLAHLLGEKKFNELARLYVVEHPSTYKSARFVGQDFANFIQKKHTIHQAYLAEMATFEWLLTASFDEKDQSILSIDDMATIEPEAWAALTFQLHPCVYRMKAHWNILILWQAVQHQKKLPPIQKLSIPLEIVVWRKANEVFFISLKPYEAFFLDSLKKGETFEFICEGLCKWFRLEKVSLKAAFLLKRFILDEMIVR